MFLSYTPSIPPNTNFSRKWRNILLQQEQNHLLRSCPEAHWFIPVCSKLKVGGVWDQRTPCIHPNCILPQCLDGNCLQEMDGFEFTPLTNTYTQTPILNFSKKKKNHLHRSCTNMSGRTIDLIVCYFKIYWGKGGVVSLYGHPVYTPSVVPYRDAYTVVRQ